MPPSKTPALIQERPSQMLPGPGRRRRRGPCSGSPLPGCAQIDTRTRIAAGSTDSQSALCPGSNEESAIQETGISMRIPPPVNAEWDVSREEAPTEIEERRVGKECRSRWSP